MPELADATGAPIRKVLIAVPCGDQVAAGFAQDLALLMAYTTFVQPDLQLPLYFLKGTYLPRARAALAQKALDLTCTHILWLDADMRFPKDALLRLLSHGRSIVCANYPTRQSPILPTAKEGKDHAYLFDGEGLAEASAVGMGCMLTATDVFLTLPKPWFAIGYNRAADDYAGEDTFFCDLARKHDYSVLVDHTLSDALRHVGTFEFDLSHARMTRDAALSQRKETA